MSTRVRQAFQSAAGAAGGGGLNVEDVFSTYLYKGTSANQSITNGIDLSTEGGLVWVKNRNNANDHVLVDTERGALNYLHSSQRYSQQDASTGINAFNTDGFDVDGIGALWNNSSYNYASWTFRKAPKFFDVVTYTGDGTSGRSISHNLGCDVGIIIIKNLTRSSDWHVWHRGFTSISYGAALNQTYSEFTNGGILTATPTSTTVTIKNPGYDGAGTNNNGDSYVMYLFAHNDGDGDFGPTGDQDIIKCGSYTGNGSNDGPEIDLGFEPQWLLIKDATSSSWNWMMVDAMRGCPVDGPEEILMANTSGASQTPSSITSINLTPTGFKIADDYGAYNTNGNNIIYIAIRRGPMAVPTSATDVFDVQYSTSAYSKTSPGFTVDFAIADSSSKYVFDRMRGTRALVINNTDAEFSWGSSLTFDYQDGFSFGLDLSYFRIFQWRRAPNYFDVVAYGPFSSTSTAKTISHNLGVAPEMMWVKVRGDSGSSWVVYHKDVAADPETDYLQLNSSSAASDLNVIWNDTAPTATSFTVGTTSWVQSDLYGSIAYLFASLDGVSKVGSYTGTGSGSQTIDCGFSNGARFVLIKDISDTGNWYLFDETQGIVAGDDPYLRLNTTAASTGGYDLIDPVSSGFIVNTVSPQNMNVSGHTYIFYAIA